MMVIGDDDGDHRNGENGAGMELGPGLGGA